jgi:hypothetical protein
MIHIKVSGFGMIKRLVLAFSVGFEMFLNTVGKYIHL